MLARELTLDAVPPVIFSPISSALPAVETKMTRLAPLASSTTLPATSASMVTLRSMQSAEPPSSGHMLSSNS
eukprot:scaffold28282_cov74-Phaeocystis_antarctica.AAC.2